MRRELVRGLVCTSVLAVLVTMAPPPAEAGCKNLPPHMCAAWITGSVLCNNLINGVPAREARDCNAQQPETCPIVTECTIFGTIGSDPACSDPTVPPDPAATCDIQGDLACFNPGGSTHDGNAFVSGPLSETAGSTVCTQGGTCINEATVQPDAQDVCPGPGGGESGNGWTVDFTPTEFKGEVCICPGNFDDFGVCCANGQRKQDGSCKKIYGDGTPQCITEFCTRSENAPPGTQFDCTEIE